MTLNLKDREWKEFFIEDIADIVSGRYIYETERIKGNIPYVTATAQNNGVGYYVGNENKTLESDCLSVNRNGSVGYSFYHPYPALFSNDCRKLRLKKKNKYLGLFISCQITAQKGKYGYGYKMGTGRIKRQKIMLPSNAKGEPDYDFMEQYMQNKEQTLLQKHKYHIINRLHRGGVICEILPQREWKEFFITDVFTNIQRGKRLKKDDHVKGNIPYVSSTAINNGVDGFIGNKEKVRLFKDCLTLANSGSVGATFYQPFQLVASDHVTKLENENYNKYVYLFIANMVSRLSEKYSFNREINDTRIKKEKIMLPVNLKGEPDYDYMEQYMKALEYKKLKAYLDWKN